MDLIKFEKGFFWGAAIIFVALLFLIAKSNIATFDAKFSQIVCALLLLPLAILAIYYISKINSSVLAYYARFRNQKEKEIRALQKKEKIESDIKKRIEYTDEISNLLSDITDFQDNRLTKQIFISFISLVGAALFSAINIGQYFGFSNWIVPLFLFYRGLYGSVKSLSEIIIAKK